ncbi:MAG: hypothetical protein QOC81_1766 [Thermoanaerobaculia bacterium]|nr:hypothetical protein [Thermoanaerobaculia bacterium]
MTALCSFDLCDMDRTLKSHLNDVGKDLRENAGFATSAAFFAEPSLDRISKSDNELIVKTGNGVQSACCDFRVLLLPSRSKSLDGSPGNILVVFETRHR